MFQINPIGETVHDSIAQIVNLASASGMSVRVRVGEDGFTFVQPEEFAKIHEVTVAMEALNATITGPLAPLFLSVDPENASAYCLSIGGIPADVSGPSPLEVALADLAFIQEISRNYPQGEWGSYVVGRKGEMNAESRIATIGTTVPIEVALKLIAITSPGMSLDRAAILGRDIHKDGRVVVRSGHDWAEVDIDDLVARAKDEISISLEESPTPYGV